MNSAILAATLALGVANADFVGDLSKASSACAHLGGSVEAWNSGKGLIAALGIQGYFPTVSDAVQALAGDSVNDAEVNPTNVIAFGTAVAGLLDDLTAKAADFKAVGAGSIVANDIKSIDDDAVKIVSNILDAVNGDEAKHNSLTSVLTVIGNAFTSANSAYGLTPPVFPSA